MRRRSAYFVLPALCLASIAVPTAAHPAVARAAPAAQRVEDLSLRSEDRQVFANPDGTWTAEITAGPVRVRLPDGSWTPVDTTLHRRPDGSVEPVAAAAGLLLSGGGSGPLVRLTHGSRSLALGWPGVLPAPALSGDTATYAEVLPGVDLRVTALPSGFGEQLVVKTPAAAANPALARVSFPLSADGVSVRAAADGSLRAVDATGRPVFEAPPPTMWDSPSGSTVDSLAPRQERPVQVTVTPTVLSLTPDHDLLTDPAAHFPLILDPTFTTYGATKRREVDAYHPDSTTFSTVPSGNLAMGYQDFQPPTLVRSFMGFPLGYLIWGATIMNATLSLYENYSASHDPDCVIGTKAQLWSTGGIDASTTWNNQPPWSTLLAESPYAYGNGANPSCSARAIEFNVTARVALAATVHNGVTFGLKASDESDPIGWRKFSAASDKVKLVVQYNHKPVVRSVASVPATSPGCYYDSNSPGGNANTPHANPGAAGMIFKATVADSDQNQPAGHSESLTATFQLWQYGVGTGPLWQKAVGPAAPGSFTAPAVRLFEPADPNNPAKILKDQTVYNWRVSITDGTGTSPWSTFCQFKVDLSHPNTPQVSSAAYPVDGWAGGVGVPGTFTLDRNGSTDATSFRYSFDTPTLSTQIAVGASGASTLPAWTPTTQGIHHLYATSVNQFGVTSTQYADYRFFVDPASQPYGQWKLDEDADATTAPDSGTGGHPATVVGTGITWGNGRVDGGVNVDGTAGSYLSTAANLPTQNAFSLSAWATLADPDLDYVVAGESGGFVLGYCSGHWTFAVATKTCTGATASVSAAAPPTASTWYHLAGVYDSAAHLLRLYVNGTAAGTAAYTGTVNTTGTIELGCVACPDSTVPDGETPWGIDDARAYKRILTPAEVTGIVNTAWQEVGRWSFDESSGTVAADSSTNGYPATLTGGATFATGGHNGNAASFAGTAPAASTQLPVLRLNRSFSVTAWVKLTQTTGTHTVLSQDGTATSGFVLRYVNDTDGTRWLFAMPNEDSAPPDYGRPAFAPSAVPTGFIHLAAVYDASNGQLRLYVNGRRADGGFENQPWNASGPLQIGRDKATGSYGNNWAGLIDEVHVYWGVVSDDLIRQQAGI